MKNSPFKAENKTDIYIYIYLDFQRKNLRKVGNQREMEEEENERNWGPWSFLSFGHASLLLRPIPQITNNFALFLSSFIYLSYLCCLCLKRDDTITTTMPIAITTVSASKVGTTFDAPTSWTTITASVLLLISYHVITISIWFSFYEWFFSNVISILSGKK